MLKGCRFSHLQHLSLFLPKKEKKKKKKHQGTKHERRKPRDTKGEGGGTKQGQAHGEPRSGRPTKQTTQAPRPRAPGAGNQRKPETTRAHRGRTRRRRKKKHQGTKQERRKPRDTKGEGGGGATTKEQPTAKRETQTRCERTESQAAGGREKQPTWNGNSSEREGGNPSPEGAKQSRKTKRPKEKVRRTRTRPGGRPARPGQAKHAHEHTGTPAAVRKAECAPSHDPTNTPPPHTTHHTPPPPADPSQE